MCAGVQGSDRSATGKGPGQSAGTWFPFLFLSMLLSNRHESPSELLLVAPQLLLVAIQPLSVALQMMSLTRC